MEKSGSTRRWSPRNKESPSEEGGSHSAYCRSLLKTIRTDERHCNAYSEGTLDSISIREILDQVQRGQIRIPAFQRGFVWEPDRVAYLMDSLYKRYPFGSLLFWRTKEKLKADLSLGPFNLPDPKADYPIDYVLDGQQRVTSIFGVFQTDLPHENPVFWRDIYFDLTVEKNPQDSQFFALDKSEVDPARHFPLNTIFDTTAYRKATKEFDDDTAKRVDDMQAVFKEVQIPVQLSMTEDKATVALIFERVNRQGVPLDTLQLLSAWTWSEEFQLQEQFVELAEQLEPFGFEDIGDDTNLLLRCCSAILTKNAAPDSLMSLNGQVVRENFGKIANGIKYAVDYLRSHFQVFSIKNLPFSTMLVPLSVFFAVEGTKQAPYTNAQRIEINRWFWRSAFLRRYSSAVLRTLNADIEFMEELREGTAKPQDNWDGGILPDYFLNVIFGMGNVDTKTFILMLAQCQPLSFISGAPINLASTLMESNRTEFHHLMPRAFLRSSKQNAEPDSCLANFAFLSRVDNRTIGGVAPSIYKVKLAQDVNRVLEHALCPTSLFSDDYKKFIRERAVMLAEFANKLMV